ncbi:MAG: hypothetical protein INQ03_15980 [Candidatus Heimdallarchaeota archaeon]|nr:hypothetical protein [Candidatus Heimdallarchaeota archaeon]
MKKPTLIIFILEIVAALIGLVSAFGSNCITFDLDTVLADLEPGKYNYQIVQDLHWLWYITTILTYMAAFASVVMIWAILKEKEWFYMAAISTAAVGAISGWIPYTLIVMDGGFTPSIMRALVYTILLVLLLIPGLANGVKFGKTQVKEMASSDTPKQVSTTLAIIGLITIAFSAMAGVGHDLTWVTWGYSVAQIIILLASLGASMLIVAVGMFFYTQYQYNIRALEIPH